jgi:hypothetical protein
MATQFMAVIGGRQAGKASKAQGKLQKNIAIRNQESLNRQAKAEKEASKTKEARIARQQKITSSAQKALAAKAGVSLEGASLSVLTDTAEQFYIDRAFTLRGGLLRSQELQEKGRIIFAQGAFAKRMGVFASRNFNYGAGAQAAGAGFQSAPAASSSGQGTSTSTVTTTSGGTGGSGSFSAGSIGASGSNNSISQ